MGEVDQARALYQRCSRQMIDASRGGAQTILNDFAALREAELSHPLMDEIETTLSHGEVA
jgi:hypothetical protein